MKLTLIICSIFRSALFSPENVIETTDEEKSGNEEEEDESESGPESVERTDNVVTKSVVQKSGVNFMDRTASTDILEWNIMLKIEKNISFKILVLIKVLILFIHRSARKTL